MKRRKSLREMNVDEAGQESRNTEKYLAVGTCEAVFLRHRSNIHPVCSRSSSGSRARPADGHAHAVFRIHFASGGQRRDRRCPQSGSHQRFRETKTR